MNFKEGSYVGAYQILSLLGAGGMGEVYRARDTKLGRDVAIKVLPSDVAQVPERLARFGREAHLLASLNHPHIAAIHGLEEADGHPFLVLELVEGEDLSERLRRGPLSLEEAMALARQLAEALEAAHAKGIVHRDLKPGNIKVRRDGTIKVLDFGLAKVFAEETGEVFSELSLSPTMSRQATAVGVILGTAAYMSPEQAKGKAVDKRADIWAFGCVLFEMLTGRRTFAGETVSEIFAEILKGEPDWSRLPGDCPDVVRNLLQRCLTKDPKHRLRDIGDAWVALSEASPPPRVSAAVPKTEGKRYSAPLLLASVLASSVLAALVTAYLRPVPPAPAPTRRFTIRLDERPGGGGMALSPDGARMAYVARTAEGVRRLALRHLGENHDRVLAGTEDAIWPFFSPDGAWIGFLTIADTQAGTNRIGVLKKISVEGGAPVTLQEDVFVGAATWGEDDAIVFQSALDQKLMRIPSVGGAPQTLGLAREDTWYPAALLPGGDALLALNDAGSVALFSLRGDEFEPVVDSGADHALYVPTGHVVYFSRGKLLAVPFDRKRFEVTATGVPVAEGVSPFQWAFSKEGTLVYGLASKRSLVWVSREGAEETLPIPPGYYQIARVAPDGTRIALSHLFRFVENSDVWVYELARGTMGRLTLDPVVERFPLWSLDGRKVVFISRSADERILFSKSSDGTSAAELLLTSPYDRWPYSWSRDGEHLVFEEDNPETGSDIGMLSMDGKGTVTPVIRDSFDQTNPAVSPDGRFIAYESNESGSLEVYVQRFPGLGEKWQISTRGGTVPLWGRDSKELFYRDGESVMVVRIEIDPTLRPGESRVLFRGDYVHDVSRAYEYDRSRDRFLMMKDDESESDPRELVAVTNWFEELERLAPTK